MTDRDWTLETRLESWALDERPFGVLWPGDYDWYVDSVHGDDAYAGTSPTYPFKTIAALIAAGIGADEKVGLAKGSHWRESLTGLANGVQILAYGNGSKPLLDCSDIIANASFTKTGGRVNVYEAAVVIDSHPTLTWVSAWEDDAQLTRATDVADCDATPGSYYPSSDAVNNITLYVHASDSSSVITNGKVYEASTRQSALGVPQNGHANSITGRRNLLRSGSVVLGVGATAELCEAHDGSQHNFFAHTGTVLIDCTANNAYFGGVDATMFAYNEDTPADEGVTFTRCIAQLDAVSDHINGFGGHNNIGGLFGAVTYTDCQAINCATGFASIRDYTTLTFTRCIVRDAYQRGWYVYDNNAVYLADCQIIGNFGTGIETTGLATIVIDGLLTCMKDPAYQVFVNSACNLTLQDSVLHDDTALATRARRYVQCSGAGVGATVVSLNNVFGGNARRYYSFVTEPTSWTSDNNCFLDPAADFIIGATTYTTFALYQVGEAPQDAGSVAGGCDVSSAPC